jgi:hypothetical protein
MSFSVGCIEIKELDGVNALIDWSEIESLLGGIHNKVRGEKTWPSLMIFNLYCFKFGVA